MNFSLKIGRGTEDFTLDDSKILQVVLPPQTDLKPCGLEDVEYALDHPVGTAPLLELLRRKSPQKVVVVVNDITRPTPYDLMVPPILHRLAEGGIRDDQVTFVVATGIHEPHTKEQDLQVYGPDIVNRFKIVNHVSGDLDSLIPIGTLASGAEMRINRIVAEADFIITLGVVMPHYFAGYSGGRKSIMPGVTWKETVEGNHSRMVELMDALPDLDSNPVSLEMIEGAEMAGVDFILNVVTDEDKNVVKVSAGHLVKAWREAASVSASLYEVPLKGLADVTIASASGHPRDINVYQAQKALDHADKATRDGGAIVLLGECPGGYGEPVFEEWMKEATCPEDIIKRIRTRFKMGGHKAFGIAKVAMKKKIYMVTSLDEEKVRGLFATKVSSVEEALSAIREERGEDLTFTVMPEGGLTVPVLSR